MKKYKIIMLLISIAVFAAVLIYSNPFVIADKIANSNYYFIAAAFGLSVLAVCIGVMKWKVLLKKVGYAELFPVQVLGYTISNFTPGKAAEPAKAVLLKMRSNVDISYSLASIIWERISDVIVLVMLSMLAINFISLSSEFFLPGMISIIIFIGIIIVSLAVMYNKKFGMKLFSFLRKLPLLNRLPKNFMDLFYRSSIEKSRIIKSFVLSMSAWLTLGAVLYFSLLAFGAQANFFALTGIVALSVVIGIASSLPGGIGTTELVMIFLLGAIGIDPGVAAAATITFRLTTIWFLNILGGLSFVYLSRKFEVKKIFR